MGTASALVHAIFGLAFALSMLAVIWFAVHLSDRLDRLRDTILTGILEGRELSYDHRTMMLANDWLPKWVGLGITLAGYTAILMIIPYFGGGGWYVFVVCWIAAIPPALAASACFVFMPIEYLSLSRHLKRLRAAHPERQSLKNS